MIVLFGVYSLSSLTGDEIGHEGNLVELHRFLKLTGLQILFLCFFTSYPDLQKLGSNSDPVLNMKIKARNQNLCRIKQILLFKLREIITLKP